RPGVHPPERPPLELPGILRAQLLGTAHRHGLADHVELSLVLVRVPQARTDQVDGEMCDINADPAALELLCSVNRGAAAAEGIGHGVPRVAAGGNDALQESDRLLSR